MKKVDSIIEKEMEFDSIVPLRMRDHRPTIKIRKGKEVMITKRTIVYPKGRRKPFREEEILGKPITMNIVKKTNQEVVRDKEEVQILEVKKKAPQIHTKIE